MMYLKEKIFDLLTPECELSKTIIVTGFPRSGTTWMAEIIREISGSKLLNEPLRQNTPPRAGEVGFNSRKFIGPSEEHPQKKAFLSNVLKGKVGKNANWYFKEQDSFGKLNEHFTNRKLVVKFCRAGGIIHWLDNQFDMKGIVTIIRHPCATIDSMMRWADYWKEPEGEWLQKRRLAYKTNVPENIYNRFKDIFQGFTSWEENLAIMWCLEYYFLLEEYPNTNNKWILISYERLLIDGESEIKNTISKLGLDTDSTNIFLSRPSKTASDSLNSTNLEEQIYKYKKNLSTVQIDQILKIVDTFGINYEKYLSLSK